MSVAADDITGVILAGGKASRMAGEDKGLIVLGGQPMVVHVIKRLQPQVGTLAINANRHLERYAAFGFPVHADSMPDYPGPLAGMLTALSVARTPLVMVAPCDSPFIPLDLVERLKRALEAAQAELSVVSTEGRLQPVFALLSARLLAPLREYLDRGGRKIDRWFTERAMCEVDFTPEAHAFENVNTPEERAAAEQYLERIA
jgi:molybdopterin-guanine dinucleotide biosynthesis protein A